MVKKIQYLTYKQQHYFYSRHNLKAHVVSACLVICELLTKTELFQTKQKVKSQRLHSQNILTFSQYVVLKGTLTQADPGVTNARENENLMLVFK